MLTGALFAALVIGAAIALVSVTREGRAVRRLRVLRERAAREIAEHENVTQRTRRKIKRTVKKLPPERPAPVAPARSRRAVTQSGCRCRLCNKDAFSAREQADAAVQRSKWRFANQRTGQFAAPLDHAYYEPRCGQWHVSSSRSR